MLLYRHCNLMNMFIVFEDVKYTVSSLYCGIITKGHRWICCFPVACFERRWSFWYGCISYLPSRGLFCARHILTWIDLQQENMLTPVNRRVCILLILCPSSWRSPSSSDAFEKSGIPPSITRQRCFYVIMRNYIPNLLRLEKRDWLTWWGK